jgi:archaemetzincin
MSSVSVVPIYLDGREALVASLSDCIERTFHVTVRVRTPWFEPQRSFDDRRGQYNANGLLCQLLTDPPGADDEGSKILGVMSRDLFAPALTYVFGEGQFNGRAAIVSIERLRTEAYGLLPDDRLLHERLSKEAIHELGHTYGLVHCRDGACVMHPSAWAEQIDFKSARFCLRCLRSLPARRP